MRLALLAALAVATPSFAQITPIWSSTESEVIPYDAQYARTEHVLLDDGSAFMVASETSRPGLAGTLRLGADGEMTLGQFGHRPVSGGRLSPEAVLAASGDRVLLAMTELDNTRALVVLVDSSGQTQWVRPRYGRAARFLANGDVLLAAGNELMRLRGSDGDLVWVRNLLDFSANAFEVSFQLPTTIGDGLPLSLSFAASTPNGPVSYPDPVLVALDVATGELQWRRDREAAPARVFESCAPAKLANNSVHAYFELVGAQVDVVFERRSDADGALLWATRVPAVDYSDGPCGFVASSTLLALSTREETTQSTLVALSHSGVVLWRTTLPTMLPAELQAAADGALLVASQQLLSAGFGTVAERRRSSDGGIDWAVEIPGGRNVDWRQIGGELRIAWSIDDGAAQLHLQRRNAATGTLIVAHQGQPEGVGLRPTDIEFVGSIPYAVMAGGGADQRGVRVRRLDPDTGAVLWSREIQIDETPGAVVGASVTAGAAARLVVSVSYSLPDAAPARRQAILSINSDNGDLLWQTAQFATFSGGAQATVTGDGGVNVRHGDCVNPPGCTQIGELLSRLSEFTGQPVWTVPSSGTTLGSRGIDLIVQRFDTGTSLAALSGASGGDLWSQALPTNSSLLAMQPASNGDLHTARQTLIGGRFRSDVERRLAATGNVLWNVQPGGPTDSVRAPLLTPLPGGDLLLTTRMTATSQPGVSRPLLARIDPISGAIAWQQNPALDNGRWLTVRAVDGATPSHQWARSLRIIDDIAQVTEERYALTTLALSSGFIGVEHLYGASYDAPMGSPVLGYGLLTGVSFDATARVENRSVDGQGLNWPRLQRWPAPGPHHGDILLRRLGDDQRITALGSSTDVVIEIESNSTAAIAGILVGFASTEDGLKAQLRNCQMVLGTGTCPAQIGSSLDQTVSLGGNAVMRLRYEVHDPDFDPKQARSGDGARGLFHVDPPFAYGDADLGNNIAEIRLALGGTSNGFE